MLKPLRLIRTKYDKFYKQKSALRDLDVMVGRYSARFIMLP